MLSSEARGVALAVVGVLVAVYLWRRRHDGFGEPLKTYVTSHGVFQVLLGLRRGTDFATVTIAGHECGGVTTHNVHKDINNIARRAATYSVGETVFIYILPSTNMSLARRIIGAIMQARGATEQQIDDALDEP